MSELKTRLQNAANEINAALALPEDTGDVAALKADNILLRGTLRYVYQQAQKLQLAVDPMYFNTFDDTKTRKVDDIWKTIHHASTPYQADTQTIIGEEVNIPIPDMFE